MTTPAARVLRLWPNADAARQAAAAVQTLGRGLPASTVDEACQLTTDLVTSAAAHAHTLVTVAVSCDRGRLSVAVHADDPTGRPAGPGRAHEAGREDFALNAVRARADVCGVVAGRGGNTTWFRLP